MRSVNIGKCTIVVSSCDAYEELWDPFFTLLYRAWPSNPFPVVLNTENKNYENKNFEITCSNATESMPWGKRLKNVLQKIETPYILFLLDDFWIDGRVNELEIFNCIQRMEEDKEISVFSFMETFSGKYDDGKFPLFERRSLFGAYRFNCQAALWRRKHFIQYLRDDESPWDWEVYGNWRSYRYFKRKFYSRKADSAQIIPYIFTADGQAHGGLVLVGGKWYLPLIEYFEKKYAIHIDRGTHGTLTEEEFCNRYKAKGKEEEKPVWKRKLSFLRKPYYAALHIKNIVVHIKHIF